MENKGATKLKRKITVLIISMLLFLGFFTYGAYRNMEKPVKEEKPPKVVENSSRLLENVWIIEGKDSEITYFYEDQKVTIETAMQLSSPIKEVVGDLAIENGLVHKVKLKPDTVSGKVISLDENSIQLEVDGVLQSYELSKQFHGYRRSDAMQSFSLANVLVGYNNVAFTLEDEEICAGIMEREAQVQNIRVLVRTSNFEELLHNAVVFTCTSDYTVKIGSKSNCYKAGKKITVKPNSKIMKSGRIVIIPDEEDGKVKLLNVDRTCGTPSYHGFIEIAKYEDKLTVINELSLEEYLYAVIPSEMPTNYGEEALKVQAVCARTYAYKQLLQNHYSNYGAHIDDSVASQVYNNIAEDKESIKAVKDTYGEVMLYENDIIEAYYFSTSWGCTADAKDVWIGDAASYLNGELQITKDSKKTMEDYDFSDEEAFKKFLTSKKIKTYDSGFPWYRWKTTIPADKLKESVEKSIEERYEANPNLILTLSGDVYVSKPVSSIGKIEGIEVANRTKNGLINEIIIKGSEATIKVCSEYNIRRFLAPLQCKIERSDKSEVDTLTMLPSAFFMVAKNEKGDGFTFSGGGYGHGVGMSQNGAKAMSEAGFNYSSILQHYYKGATLGNLYL